MNQQFENMPIEQLYKQWGIASVNATHYSKALKLNPESDSYAADYAKWDLEEKLLIAEIERRAELFPMPVLHDVINSGIPFSFRA